MRYIILLAILFLLELLYFRVADHFNIIDKPNERSSHSRVTLRGGGIIFYIGVLLCFFISGFQNLWFFAGLTLIAVISFADDIKPRSSKLRLFVHFAAMLLMFYQCGLFATNWYFVVVVLIVCTGIINAYNFMDGINGITGLYSLIMAGSLLFVNNFMVQFADNEIIVVFALSLFVFLFFNFRTHAKCFAGDVGSISAAFILTFLLLRLIIKTENITYLMFFAVYGVDAVFTIIHRIILRENISKPHRKHIYQLLANELHISHLAVSSIYAILQLVINAGLVLLIYFNTEIWLTYLYILFVIVLLSIIYIVLIKKHFWKHAQNNG
jgi:UDP-N-acetylmuramyl pentapeptide phosphotransferase/UDP-N-acetylglucosamine-1-phosphate transferase